MNTTNNNSYLTDPLAKLQLMQNEIDLLYAGYKYRQAQRELEKKLDIKTKLSNDQQVLDMFKGGIWGDYSKGDVVTKVLATDKDGNPKYDKNGNPVMKNLYHTGAIALNFLGNTAKYSALAMSFIKDKETANNALNDYATSFRKQGQLKLLSTGNPYLMAAGALSMLSDKVGGTASASKTGNFWTDAGNTVASFVPFLGFAGKNAGEFIERDDVNASSTYANIGDVYGARSHSKGKFLFNGNGIKSSINDSNMKSLTISNDILLPGKRDLASAMDDRWGISAKFDLNEGYDLTNFMRAKYGAVLLFSKRSANKNKIRKKQNSKLVIKYTPSGNVEMYLQKDPSYEEWVKDIPEDWLGELYDLRLAYELLDKEQLNAWKYAVTSDDPDFFMNIKWPVLDENGNPIYNDDGEVETYYPYHLGSIAEELDKNGEWTGNYVFLKLGKEDLNPELLGEIDYYNSGKGKINKGTHKLVFIPEENRYHYIANNPEKFKQQFKAGGKVNVIPEGALHAHKHHLTELEDGKKFEDVTTKGIPVVVEDEKGNLVQQAEVERLEIIFRLEVTKELEKLSKEGTNEAAIKAGKLLVQEILYNTIDNTQQML